MVVVVVCVRTCSPLRAGLHSVCACVSVCVIRLRWNSTPSVYSIILLLLHIRRANAVRPITFFLLLSFYHFFFFLYTNLLFFYSKIFSTRSVICVNIIILLCVCVCARAIVFFFLSVPKSCTTVLHCFFYSASTFVVSDQTLKYYHRAVYRCRPLVGKTVRCFLRSVNRCCPDYCEEHVTGTSRVAVVIDHIGSKCVRWTRCRTVRRHCRWRWSTVVAFVYHPPCSRNQPNFAPSRFFGSFGYVFAQHQPQCVICVLFPFPCRSRTPWLDNG